ncbi:glycoside hydrolase family 6 protein [Glycomyces paridis]|uniref:Glucanase n=1 Tax=Glycomyces paridis TaxID=2126555 RepID=A0A4S8P0Y3_9ACTN|nr:cellobiohydrolase [Glycomyces paridis]
MSRDRRTAPSTAKPKGRSAAALTAVAALAAALLTVLGTAPEGAVAADAGNPYAGADLYVNPEWSGPALAGGAPADLAGQGTAVWLDSIGAIEGSGGMGLAEHLDEALEQRASAPSGELVVQIVLYNLPGRDCAALHSNGELAPDEIDRYRYEFVDPIAAIIARPEYADLRVTAVIEPFSLAYLPDHVSPHPGGTPQCDEVLALGSYQEGVAYAVAALADAGVHNYVDAGGHGLLGWSDATPFYDTFGNAARLYATIFDHGAEPGDVQGIAVNTADYSPLEEPYFDADDVVSGVPVAQTFWVDFRGYVDETPFALDFRDRLVAEGFASDLGVIVDTSRNGWGGPDRPTRTSASTDPNIYVNESRIDRRQDQEHRCNQVGAGLGERPQADPIGDPRLHAYVWIKPPGESDGPHADNDGGFGSICAPELGSLPNSPPAGAWFQAQFEQLMVNAWPPL